MGIYQCAGFTAQLPVIKPAQKHKYNTTQYKYTITEHYKQKTK